MGRKKKMTMKSIYSQQKQGRLCNYIQFRPVPFRETRGVREFKIRTI